MLAVVLIMSTMSYIRIGQFSEIERAMNALPETKMFKNAELDEFSIEVLYRYRRRISLSPDLGGVQLLSFSSVQPRLPSSNAPLVQIRGSAGHLGHQENYASD